MKDKTISLRIDVPTYANIITKAHESNKNLSEFVLDKVQEDRTKDIKELKATIKDLEIKLKAKPKTITKEVVKIDKAAVSKAAAQIDTLKATIKDLEGKLKTKPKTITKEVVKVDERALNAAKKEINELKQNIDIYDKNQTSLRNFINGLNLYKHKDNTYTFGKGVFNDGTKVNV